jgi:hypothetical protein
MARFPRVNLYGRDGAFVATIETLPWNGTAAWPDAIQWGSRIFIKGADDLYREGFAWHCLTAPSDPLDTVAVTPGYNPITDDATHAKYITELNDLMIKDPPRGTSEGERLLVVAAWCKDFERRIRPRSSNG